MPSVRSGMSTGILLMLVLSALLMVWSASKADAQTACQAKLDALENAISDAPLNVRDEESLRGKLQQAEEKLSEGKTADAAAKITNISTTAEKKLGSEDAQDIVAAANAAIGCLEASSGT